MPTPKALPKISFSMGATKWGLSIQENGNGTTIDFSSLDRSDRRKARRMIVSILEASGYFGQARTASKRRAA